MTGLLVSKQGAIAAAQREIDLSWCGGYLSARGSLGVRNYMRRQRSYRTVSLQLVRSPGEMPDLLRLCQVTGIPVTPQLQHQTRRGDKAVLTVQGDTLDEMLRSVWKYLTRTRQEEYRNLKGELLE